MMLGAGITGIEGVHIALGTLFLVGLVFLEGSGRDLHLRLDAVGFVRFSLPSLLPI